MRPQCRDWELTGQPARTGESDEENMSSPALQVCGQWHTPLSTHVHATHTCTQSLKREEMII